MNERDAHNLMADALLKISRWVGVADADVDADAWQYLENIKYLCDDVIEHVSRERGSLIR